MSKITVDEWYPTIKVYKWVTALPALPEIECEREFATVGELPVKSAYKWRNSTWASGLKHFYRR